MVHLGALNRAEVLRFAVSCNMKHGMQYESWGGRLLMKITIWQIVLEIQTF